MTEEQFQKMVDEVSVWLHRDDPRNQQEFQSCKENELIMYHHTLGRAIRNHFKLWENHWEPQLEEGVDVSPNHPDAVSMRIIEEVWKKVQ